MREKASKKVIMTTDLALIETKLENPTFTIIFFHSLLSKHLVLIEKEFLREAENMNHLFSLF